MFPSTTLVLVHHDAICLYRWQAWRVAHPPARGMLFNGTRPLVHRGFLSSWQAKGLNSRIVDFIQTQISEMQLPAESVRILVTGEPLHSRILIVSAYQCLAMCVYVWSPMTTSVASKGFIRVQGTLWEVPWPHWRLTSCKPSLAQRPTCGATRSERRALGMRPLPGSTTSSCQTRGMSSMIVRRRAVCFHVVLAGNCLLLQSLPCQTRKSIS